MLPFTESDVEALAGFASTVERQQQRIVELIQELHGVRAQLTGMATIVNLIITRAKDRARGETHRGDSRPQSLDRG